MMDTKVKYTSPDQYSKASQSGLTLIELLVAMVLIVILATAVLGLQYILGQNRKIAIDNYYNVDRANVNMNAIVREIRTARLSENGSYPIESAGDNQIVFFSDLDFDGQAERVRYTLSDNVLEKGVTEPTGAPAIYPPANEKVASVADIVRNQENPMFTYYNGDWPNDTVNNPLSTPPSLSEIKLVKVYLRLNVEDSEPGNDYILESFAGIRMLKDNL